MLNDLKRVAPWLVPTGLIILGIMFLSTLSVAKKNTTVEVKIIKVENALPGTKLGTKTLVQFPDGRRVILKGDYGTAGESFLYNTNNHR
jgi:hypothetical protein